MSAPAPASRRSGSGSRRFNPLKVLQPKRRLQQILASSTVPVPKPASGTAAPVATAPVAIPVPAPPAFDYCRFIELDYVPMETGYMVSMRPTKGYASTKSPTKGYTSTKSPDRHTRSTNSPNTTPRSRRTPAPTSNRDPYGNASHSSSSNSGSCKGSDCSPTKGRHQKYTSCTDNHGIRPPPPEQYLTPLQQKEVCIRHLRARLKETIDTLQNRDTEIDELRGQLYRMQEDWVEEECHRVEAQLALKEARQEIQQLKQAVDTVRARLSDAGGLSGDVGVQKYFHDINTQNHKLENLLLSMELAQAGLAKEGEGIPGCRTRVGGSAPASVSGESPGGIPKPAVGGRGSCSCDGSPARSLTRSSTYTKLSDQALADRNSNGQDFPCLSGDGTQDSGFVCCGESSVPSRADLLLEAAFLSEETASLLNAYTQTFSHSMPNSLPNSLPHTYSHTLPHSFPHNLSHSLPHNVPHSSTYEKLCTGERLAPLRCGLGGMGCMSHPCLSHHHLYLHPLRETGIQTESCPIPATAGYPSDLDTIAEQRTFRSQACSPTSTWMSDEGEEDLDSITTTTSVTTATVMSTATEPIPVSKTPLLPPLPRSATVACSMESPLCDKKAEEEKQEKEKREKESDASEKCMEVVEVSRVEEEGQQIQTSSVEENKSESQEEVEEAAPENLGNIETAEGKHGLEEVEFGKCTREGEEGRTGETIKISLSREKRQQEVVLIAGSPEPETADFSPSCPGLSLGIDKPHTSQPKRSTSNDEITGVSVTPDKDDDGDNETTEQGATGGAEAQEEESASDSGEVQKSYWSRHFLVDLLAVAIPVVPTVAWLCRGPVRDGQPMYHIGSLLRGCCTVALHSLRRGGGLRHYPAGGGDLGGSHI
ncbi:syntaphilin isoform X2 [Sphaeramia orbicularis]|uniref:syntaphilin isoform X2 n=1 Tax=Sphaeramia orbicularis TaxID=375764 RepID=UPI00117D10C5|nr:syntaphilin isoform X2 [Sphaeramia orbicularis]